MRIGTISQQYINPKISLYASFFCQKMYTIHHMSTLKIRGGKKLGGKIIPQGNKNEALEVMCAVLLTDEEIRIENIPDILDVQNLLLILKKLGVEIKKENDNAYTFCAKNVAVDGLRENGTLAEAAKLRGSLMIAGPLLGRFKKASMPKPGGDKIGRRRFDTHLAGFEKLGATITHDANTHSYEITASKLSGAYILFEYASVTGTANVIMASVLAEGTSTLYNAACEPHVQELCKMLNDMGAKISGVGSNMLMIEGVEKLHGCTHRVLPDMIEIGSFIGLAAMTGSALTIADADYGHLGNILDVFRKLGIKIEQAGKDISIPAQEHYVIEKFLDGSILTIKDDIWPSFPADLLSLALVVATQAKGSVLIHQSMYESRLFFVDKLIDMGAQIILCDPHRAVVIGLDRTSLLRGITMSSPDIRAGVALLIAALSAEGESTIYGSEQIDRGYEKITERLKALGAQIERVD